MNNIKILKYLMQNVEENINYNYFKLFTQQYMKIDIFKEVSF